LIKAQIVIQAFYYEGRDIRDKNVHSATFLISLSKNFIKPLTHEGELVLDPFVGKGTTLLASRGQNRNAVGFDLKKEYVDLATKRLSQESLGITQQIAIPGDARNISEYLEKESVKFSITSPTYANMLNHPCKNKSVGGDLRENKHYLKAQQYSDDPKDLRGMNRKLYSDALTEIYTGIYDLIKPKSYVVIWKTGVKYA
jgi:tRNA G10  N-methylase Trm11